MKIRLLFSLFLIYPAIMFSQSVVQGNINNQQGTPLPFANLTLYQDSVFITGTHADFNGYYMLKTKPGVYDLKVSYIGFDDKIIPGIEVSENIPLELNIEMQAGLSLEEIVVVGDRYEIYRDTIRCWFGQTNCFYSGHFQDKELKKKENGNMENVTAADIQLYPNPAVEQVNIKSSQEFAALHIFNINGQLIQSVLNIQKGHSTINVSGFIPGTYILRFQEADELISKKLIVKNTF